MILCLCGLAGNDFSGDFPAGLLDATNISLLNLSKSDHALIASWDLISHYNTLPANTTGANRLSGTIPSEIRQLTSLNYLRLRKSDKWQKVMLYYAALSSPNLILSSI